MKAKRGRVSHLVRVARIRVETAVVRIQGNDRDDEDAERQAIEKAELLPDDAWDMQPFDETAYRPHVQSMISREEIAELTQEGRSADAELADLGEAIHYQLLKANCDTGEGELALQPWLEVERPDLLASDLCRGWIARRPTASWNAAATAGLLHRGPLCRTRGLICSTQCSRSCGRRGPRLAFSASPCWARSRPTSPSRRMPMCWSPSMPPWTSILLPASGAASRAGHRPSTSGADIFVAGAAGRYLGRICHYRECRPRMACRALSCGLRQHLNDDLQIVTLSPALISAPPIDLWPRVVARCAVPADTQVLLIAKLDQGPRRN